MSWREKSWREKASWPAASFFSAAARLRSCDLSANCAAWYGAEMLAAMLRSDALRGGEAANGEWDRVFAPLESRVDCGVVRSYVEGTGDSAGEAIWRCWPPGRLDIAAARGKAGFQRSEPDDISAVGLRLSPLYLNVGGLHPQQQRYLGTYTQSAIRRSFQPLRRRGLHSVNVVNFQWTVFISNFMHMRDKTVCGF